MKICLCTLGKKENKYIREFIKHYIDYGVDKIILYDNNDINGERFENVINDYIKKNYINIINYRGIVRPQIKIFNNCYNNNYNRYEWLIFFDIDEYIYLKNYSNIKDFVNNKIFNNFTLIHLNLVYHTDNNLLYYENKLLAERFPEKFYTNKFVAKTILRGHIPNIKITNAHWLSIKIIGCNGYGEKIKKKSFNYVKPDYNNYYIDHYAFKSTEEFINKINRGSCYYFHKTILLLTLK